MNIGGGQVVLAGAWRLGGVYQTCRSSVTRETRGGGLLGRKAGCGPQKDHAADRKAAERRSSHEGGILTEAYGETP